MTDTDILIAGAGPAGLATALALHALGHRVALVEARPGPALDDARVIALSRGSVELLAGWGIELPAGATAIDRIHVSQRGHLGRTLMRASDYGVPALGHVIRAGELIGALTARTERIGLAPRYGHRIDSVQPGPQRIDAVLSGGATLSARLIAWCEGRIDTGAGVAVRRRDYDQHALIARLTLHGAHGGIAYERFTPHGPVALLPFGQDYALVYTCSADEAARLLGLEDTAFVAMLQQELGTRVDIATVGPRQSWPLALAVREHIAGEHQVWLGNAAQTLHPVAGQGLNLALRDVQALTEALREPLLADDLRPALTRYAASRRVDRRATVGFTDALVRVFGLDEPLLAHARGLALLGLDLFAPARHFLARRMMFGARAWP